MGSIVVFAGPSVTREIRLHFSTLDWRPPVEAGDLLELPADASVVAIIDGHFEQRRAVWHKEILYALSQGRHVVGSASMGALRAAELCRFGMKGIGIIYHAYRSNRIDGDDEVAVRHAPAEFDWQPLTVPSINVRATIATAIAAGILASSAKEALLSSARDIFYADRNWREIAREWHLRGLVNLPLEQLEKWLALNAVDLKRRDALALLKRLCAYAGTAPASVPPPPATIFLERLFEDVQNSQALLANGGMTDGKVADIN